MKRTTVFWFVNIVGPLILLSYWRGVAAFDDPTVYWGNVSERMQGLIVPWMFVAAAGYLMMFHRFFLAWSEEERSPPCTGRGRKTMGTVFGVFFGLYAAFLLTSMVWIDLTRLYIEGPSTLGAIAIVAVFGLQVWQPSDLPPWFGRLVSGWPARRVVLGRRDAVDSVHMVGCDLLGRQLRILRTGVEIDRRI